MRVARRTAPTPSHDHAALHLVASVVWLAHAPFDPDDATLTTALTIARGNRVEREFVVGFPTRLAPNIVPLDHARSRFQSALSDTGALLTAAGVPACLIKTDPDGDLAYANFDVVIEGSLWDQALDALSPWAARTSRHPLERDKVFIHGAREPDLHLHARVSWYEVPVVDAEPLLTRSHTLPLGYRIPSQADRLCILLAHAGFQTLCLDLRDLREARELAHPHVVAAALELARGEGWEALFELGLKAASEAITELDAGRPSRLPVPLRGRHALAGGRQHVAHLLRTRRPGAATREVLFRPALVAAKIRHGVTKW